MSGKWLTGQETWGRGRMRHQYLSQHASGSGVRLGKSRGFGTNRHTLEAELLLKSIKWSGWAGSLQNLSPQLALTVTFSCIKYNKRDTAWKMQPFCAFFHYYWCISNGMRFPVLLLLCTTCFIKEPIKNLKLFKNRVKMWNASSRFLLASWFFEVQKKKKVLFWHLVIQNNQTIKQTSNNPKHTVIKSWGSHGSSSATKKITVVWVFSLLPV